MSGQKLDRETLRSIAGLQKGVLLCVLAQIVCYVLLALGAAIPDVARFGIQIGSLLIGLGAAALVFMLALKLYSTAAGIILGLLAMIPCIGLIVLLVINGKATGILKSHGIHVGLLGARSSDL